MFLVNNNTWVKFGKRNSIDELRAREVTMPYSDGRRQFTSNYHIFCFSTLDRRLLLSLFLIEH